MTWVTFWQLVCTRCIKVSEPKNRHGETRRAEDLTSAELKLAGGGCSPRRTSLPAISEMQGNIAEMQGGATRGTAKKLSDLISLDGILPTRGAGSDL